MKYNDLKSCTPKCRSNCHALELNSLLTRTNDTQTLLSGLLQCFNCQKIQDSFGRNLLHMASCCGRVQVCEWLLLLKKAEINLKTFENGWTPAHCASFYGNLDVLITLIKHGANLNKNDYDRLTPIESLCVDKHLSTRYEPDLNDDLDVYSWGSNENFNLGIGHEMKKSNAEMVEFFKKSNINIAQIVLSKFHTVFLSKTGEVYTCGFGVDGRLGHDNELTLFSPKLVEQLKNDKCIQIDASRNNTYFLTSEGILYSCGTNEFKQLGQLNVIKSLSPKPISLGKRLKGKSIKQIACSRFHVVLLTHSNEVYTFGLNAGQLGHPNEMVANATSYNSTICYVAEPRLITSLNEPDIDISLVACSDGCTVCLQPSKNLLHIFNDYKPRRLYYIKETGASFRKIRVLGGKLDHFANPDLKWIEDLGDPIQIVGLTDKNLLYIWKETDPIWRNITWAKNKMLKIIDFDLNDHGIIICTNDGSCYKADFKSIKINNQKSPQSPQFVNQTETLELIRLPFLNRCLGVKCDLRGRNFFALQYHPNTNMRYYPVEMKSLFKNNMKFFLDESLNFNDFYDIELKYKDKVYYLHKFILVSRCSKLFLKQDLINKQRIDLDQVLSQKFTTHSFEILINYIYSNECSLDVIKKVLKANKTNSEQSFMKFLNDFKETFIDKFGFSDLKSSFESNNYSKNLKEMNINFKDNEERLELMSNFFSKLLNGTLQTSSKRKQFKFHRESYQDLYDCTIELNNEQTIRCHKCILISRSDFFRNMLLGSWIESSSARIKLPFDLDLMQIFIDYLYTDEIQMEFIHVNTNYTSSLKSKSEKEIEILFNLYVLSDQLLMERLKNLCEFKLANLVNLKNSVEIFEFSCNYEANQLKDFCMEFITLNLVTLIESKQLESINVDLLTDVSSFYRNYFPIVDSRKITPYSFGPDPSKIELIPFDLIYDQKFVDGFMNENDDLAIKKKFIRVEEKKEINNKAEANIESPVIDNVNTSPELDESLCTNKNENKWEKVKKKSRRKISESNKDIQKTPVGIPNTKQTTPPFGTLEKDIEKYNEEKKQNVKKVEQIKEQWPLLGTSVKPEKDQMITKMKPINKSSKLSLSNLESFAEAKPLNSKQSTETKPVWGAKPISTTSNSNFSLIDIINEEMKKVTVSKGNEIKKDEKIKQINNQKSQVKDSQHASISKGWNLAVNNTQTKASIAEIIEMEKRSKEQYNKLKNRPLNSIQIEERAIEDLKMLYQVDELTEMTITIELVDEADFNNCIPVWKKVNLI